MSERKDSNEGTSASAQTPASQYEQDTALEMLANHRFRGHINSAWNIGDNPNGGYLAAMALAAIKRLLPHPDPVTLTVHYLRPGIPDTDCIIEVDILRSGRTLTTARARLLQNDRPCLEILTAFGDLAQSVGVLDSIEIPRPDIPAPDQCPPRSGSNQGVGLAIGDRLDVRLDPALAEPGAAGRAEIAGWIRFRDGRPPCTRSLCLFVDAYPPSTFGLLGAVGWVPTIELTVHIRRQPAAGWILGQFVTDDLQNGRMIESGKLWDSSGALVAQSRQIGLVRSG